MADRKAIFQRVSTAAWDSRRWVDAFDALERPCTEDALPLIRRYVRDKFLLSDGDGEADGLMDLADLSLRKILRLKKEGKLLGDISRLMKAAQEDFRIALSPAQSASIQTLEDLTAAILEQRKT